LTGADANGRGHGVNGPRLSLGDLRLRILVVAVLPLLMAIGLFAAYFAHHSLAEAETSLDRLGRDSALHLSNAVAYDLFAGNLPAVKRLLEYELASRQILAAAILERGQWQLVGGNGALLPDLAEIEFVSPGAWRRANTHYFAHPIHTHGEADPYLENQNAGDTDIHLVIALGREPIERTRAQVGTVALGMGSLSLVLALFLAWRLSGRVSKPLQAITATVGGLADGNLAVRIPETSQGEIGQLEHGVNRMAEALAENQRGLEQRVREATAELLGQKLAAEAAVLAKSRFLAAASHDLRQPLHALTLLVSALRESAPSGEAGRLAAHIEASASAMESLLNALLDLSRLDAGVVEARPRCVPVAQVLANVEQQFRPLAREQGTPLTIRTSAVWVRSDPALLERILANLVANALRHAGHGRVLVGVRRIGADGLRFEVRDTGRGIPEEFQTRIFEEYFQLENPERHRDKGLGLGLAIVARLARLLGGEVRVRSAPERGSCFAFECPRCQPEADGPREPQPAPEIALPLENALVAFIDDDQAILEAMVELFDQWGVALAAGEDAEQVCAELRALGRPPDLILCDYRLGEARSGIGAVALLRQAFGLRIPAALLTGDTAPDTIQAIQASGLPMLHKPLKPARLRAFLSHLLAESPTAPTTSPTTKGSS